MSEETVTLVLRARVSSGPASPPVAAGPDGQEGPALGGMGHRHGPESEGFVEEQRVEKPVMLAVRGKEIRVKVQTSALRKSDYFVKLLNGPWKETGDAVLDFPSLKMLDAFWIAFCCFVAPEEYDVRKAKIAKVNAVQVHAAACMLGMQQLISSVERKLIKAMSPLLFLRAYNQAEQFGRRDFKRRLFRWICFSGQLREYNAEPGYLKKSLCIDRQGVDILCCGRPLKPAQFYDVLRDDLVPRRRFFSPGACRPSVAAADAEEQKQDQDVIKCYVERKRNYDSGETHFILRSELDSAILLAACHVVGTSDFLFADHYPSTFERQDLLGRMECNFVGTTFVIYDHGVFPDEPSGRVFPEMLQGEHGAIIYDANIMARIPNAMTIVLPDLRKELEPGPGIVERYEKHLNKGLLILRTKKPKYNAGRESWTMDFHGRVKLASKKNFKIQESRDELHGEWLMLFGKVTKHRFSLDYKSPLSIMQAFSIALSSFSDKLMVA